MNMWQFMSDSPWLTAFLALLLIELINKVIQRGYRVMILRKNGWPPAHLDADGDWRPLAEDDQ